MMVAALRAVVFAFSAAAQDAEAMARRVTALADERRSERWIAERRR